MSNRAIWNIRRRHEWLSKPIKPTKRMKKRACLRLGMVVPAVSEPTPQS